MNSLNLTTAVLGLGLAASILLLVRRDRLHLRHGLFWMGVAAGAAVLGLWPAVLDQVARVLAIAYAPTLLLLLAVGVLLIKALLADIWKSDAERQIRRLNQRLAMLEAELQARQD